MLSLPRGLIVILICLQGEAGTELVNIDLVLLSVLHQQALVVQVDLAGGHGARGLRLEDPPGPAEAGGAAGPGARRVALGVGRGRIAGL